MVKCVTNDICVSRGRRIRAGGLSPSARATSSRKGLTANTLGYYGVVKRNPVFHLTAITHRKDALFQTVTIGGRATGAHRHRAAHHGEAPNCGLGARSLPRCASRSRCFATPSSGGMYNVRVSIQSARSGRGAQRHRRGVRQHGGRQACVRVRRRHRRVLRRAVRLGAGDALPGRPRHHPGFGLPRGAARSVARAARAPAPRSASTAPSRSASGNRWNGACRCRR